ncbi:MAG: hypothetical protein ACREKN_07840 [Longimicrobiaceae bacterium]
MRAWPVLAAALLATGCAASVRSDTSPGAVAPSAAVERFLQLASESDYAGMGWVFGTVEGSVMRRDQPDEVERRMYAIADVLRNTGYAIRGESPIPGRTGSAVRVLVDLMRQGEPVPVPFVTVRGPADRWFVEQVELEAVTSASSG